MIGWILGTSWGRTALAVGAALVAFLGALGAAMRIGSNRRAAQIAAAKAKARDAAQRRMNDAETGSGMDDSARTDWLRDFAKRNRRP